MPRVLYVAHGHPRFAKGGGELAAWRLFQHCSQVYGEESCAFLAAASSPQQLPPGCEVLGLGPREWLIRPSSNALIHDTVINLSVGSPLHQAVDFFQPDLIHLHHYLHVGIDLVLALKCWFPQAVLVLTLHEYWGMCAHEGRLLRSNGALCSGPEPSACVECLASSEARAYLAIRDQRIRRLFDTIDHFIAPSLFLRDRYVDWGLSPHAISVVENLPAAAAPDPVLPTGRSDGDPLILGYFGQVNPWKGLDVILESVAIALDQGAAVMLEVHGLDLDTLTLRQQRSEPFYQTCTQWLERLGVESVRLAGLYEPGDLSARLAGVDALVMGSIWFENSPMVIQEAYLHGVPVLAPRLGGMAEKVRHGVTGCCFAPGDPQALASLILRLAGDRAALRGLAEGARRAGGRLVRAAGLHERLYACWLRSKALSSE
jgi:glycosyltransferase involved in cell wall biosynthesis